MENKYNGYIKELYDSPAIYIKEFENYHDDIYFWPKIVDKVKPINILEVGIGNGRLIGLLHDKVKEYDGIDFSREIIEYCSREYDFSNVTLYNQDLKQGIKSQAKIPTIMYLNISTFCNLACKYCFIESNPCSKQKYEKMKFDVAKIAVDKFLLELQKNEITDSQIIIYGGEPLTNWDVVKEIVDYIKNEKKSKITITIISNGTLLDKEVIKYLMDNHIGIGISIDGPKFINDKNRIFRNGNESVYDKAMEAINLLNEMDANYCVSATVTPDVVENEKEVHDWLIDNNIKNVFWNLYHYSFKDDKWEEHYNKMTDFILNTHLILEENNIGDEKIQEQIEMFINQTFKFHSCGAVGVNQIIVKPNGDVCICQGDSRSHQNVVGNIITDEIEDIIKHPNNDIWLDMYTIDKEKCKYCPAISVCGGGCPLQSEVLFGKRNDIDEASCIYYKKLLEWLIRQYYYVAIDKEEKGRMMHYDYS